MQVCCCFTRTFRRFVIKTITDGEFNVRVFIVLTCCRRARSRSIACFCSIRCCQLTLIRCLCWQFLRSLLPSLHAHTVIEHRATLLSRYFGLYSISFQVQTNDRIVARCFSDALQGTHIHIVVMENVAWLQKGKMSSRFDLKGSWCARPSSSHSHVSPCCPALPHPA